MLKQQLKRLNLVLYHNSIPVAECSALYLGLLGLFIDIRQVSYPKFTHLEVEVVESESKSVERVMFPVVVTAYSKEGMGLTFTNYDEGMVEKWKSVLSSSTLLNTGNRNRNTNTNTNTY